MRTWKNCGLHIEDTPSKSSLSEARHKISYDFFGDIFRDDLKTIPSQLFRNFHIYAIDGDQLDLPPSPDVLAAGYRGWPTSSKRETHFVKMYTTQIIDVMSGAIKEFGFSPYQDEVYLARAFARSFETNSIAIYDRLHCGYESFLAHHEVGNYFLIRAKFHTDETSSRGVNKDLRDFAISNRRNQDYRWRPQPGNRRAKPDVPVRFVKIKNKKTKRDDIFVTNIPAKTISAKEIVKLYRRRWDIETSFRDLTHTLKLGQWHSKKLNGILQEIYALLWLVNITRRQMRQRLRREDLLSEEYSKSNFKLVVAHIVENLELLIKKKIKKFREIILYVIKRTLERRRRLSRSYPRVVKHRGKEYKQENMVPRRPKPLTERH